MRSVAIAGLLLSLFSAACPAGENYALLVGVADYDEKELRPLKFTRADVLDFHSALLDSGFKPENVVVMHDDFEKLVAHYKRLGGDYKAKDYIPTGANIRKELELILGRLRPEDSVVLAFSGHGVQFKGEKKTYFCPSDARLSSTESLIAFEELFAELKESSAGRKLLLVDACQNDPQSEIGKSRKSVDLDSVTRPQSEPVPEGIIALFSCKAGQKSFEHPPLGHGIFFYHILDGWKGNADANNDGKLTYQELAVHTEKKTSEYAALKLKVLQTPQLKAEFSGEWVLRELASDVRADVRMPNIFGDQMVLQREKPNRIWGWSDPGADVTVTLQNQRKKARTAADGRWQVTLDSMPAGGPHTLSVKSRNELRFSNVLVGEVWLCSGQSNMQWTVKASNNAEAEQAAAQFPQIRLLTIPNVGTQEPQSDFNGQWQECTPESVSGFSAVGYYFGRQIHQKLNVPVGLICNAWGGSVCEAWVRRDLLAGEMYAPLMERWEAQEREATDPKAIAAYQQNLAAWERDSANARVAGKPTPSRPPDLRLRMTGNSRPANIYNGGLKPIIGYGMRGVVWYQGESNASRAYQYREMFPLLINSWREEWGQGSFPFLWVQLPNFMAEKPEPSESSWAELREAQSLALRLPDTGQAVAIDLGEAKDIHPRNKQDVGKRLALLALGQVYQTPGIVFRSPQYRSMEKRGGRIVLSFDHVPAGWRPLNGIPPRGFAIAGENRKFVWAQARIVGSQIEVWSDEVASPVAVRYAWADNPACNMYSAEGHPLTPFRTDDWPAMTVGAR